MPLVCLFVTHAAPSAFPSVRRNCRKFDKGNLCVCLFACLKKRFAGHVVRVCLFVCLFVCLCRLFVCLLTVCLSLFFCLHLVSFVCAFLLVCMFPSRDVAFCLSRHCLVYCAAV